MTTTLRVEWADDFAPVRARWEALAASGGALAFQRAGWLEPWYATHGAAAGASPLVAFAVDRDGRDVLGLPLVLERGAGGRRIAFADGGITDYNAPVVGEGAPATREDAHALLAAMRRDLPAADRLDLEKMPESVAGRANPLALLRGAEPSRLVGNVLAVPGTWDDWHWGLEKTFRKELERSWRVFRKVPGADFARVTDAHEGARVFEELKRQQGARIAELGLPYVLDEPRTAAFYDRLVAEGLADGSAVLTALTVGEVVVAALLGVTDGAHYAMVRLSTGGAEWKSCSPGRLLIERTMEHLHAKGYRAFDFTIGEYPYKRRFGVTPVPLVDWHGALSWRALPGLAVRRAKDAARANPTIVAAVRRLRGAAAAQAGA